MQWPTGAQASDVMGASESVKIMTPLRLENTVICSFHFIKRNLRSTTAIINSELFLYQHSLPGLETPIGIFTIRPLGPCPLWTAKKISHVAKNAT